MIEFAVRASTKGDALERLRRHAGADRVFYAGDDTTDEDAFAVLRPGDVGLKIGAGDSLAGYRVRGPEDVPLVLGLIADARAAVAAEREAAAGA